MAPKKKGKKTLGPPLRNEINEDKNPNKSLTEGEKNFYRAQIRDLEERLERYQYKCDKLEVEEKDLLSKISSLGTEKKDIVLYLKRSLVQKEDELSEMAETLSQHQKDLETERKRSELQQSLLRCEHQKDREILASENTALAGRLSSLEEFSLQREKLTAKCRSLEEQLQQQHQEHKEEIYRLEKKAILDQDRLKKEMLQHVSCVAAELQRVSEEQMPETTLKIMKENVTLITELQQLSDKTSKLLKENEALRAREKRLKLENKITEELMSDITKKSVVSQKAIQHLTEKCKQVQSELERYKKPEPDHHELQKILSNLWAELDDSES